MLQSAGMTIVAPSAVATTLAGAAATVGAWLGFGGRPGPAAPPYAPGNGGYYGINGGGGDDGGEDHDEDDPPPSYPGHGANGDGPDGGSDSMSVGNSARSALKSEPSSK